ncbi:MAG: DUF2059 domain-containing protein [Rhodocyclaceae bacterium]
MRTTLASLIFAAAGALSLPVAAQAPQGAAKAAPASSPAKAALAREIIAVSLPKDYRERTLDGVSRAMEQQMAQQLPRMIDDSIESYASTRGLSEGEKRALAAEKPALIDDYRQRVLPEFNKGLRDIYSEMDPGKEMSVAMQGWYEQNFTEAELKQILAFQKTPAAAKLRDSLPQFMAQVMPQIMGKVSERARAVGQKVSASATFPDLVAKRLCSDKTPKFCNKPAK